MVQDTGPVAHIVGGALRQAFGGSIIQLNGKLSHDVGVNSGESENTLVYQWSCQSSDLLQYCSKMSEKGMSIHLS